MTGSTSGVPALTTPAGPVSPAAWEARVAEAARRLEAQAPRGGVVAFVAADPIESAALLLAALRTDVLVAPLSPRLPPAALAATAGRLGATMLGAPSPADPAALPAAVRDAGGIVIHTSGSTSEPRAALLSRESLLAGTHCVIEHVGLHAGDVWLLTLPLYHVSGLGIVLRCAAAGATVAVPDASWSLREALGRSSATHASLVTTQLHRLVGEGEGAPAALRAVLLGGGPSPVPLLDAAVEQGWPVANSYGLTEMGSTVAATGIPASVEERPTSGLPLTGRTVRVVDGEIRVGGAGLFGGYLRDGRLTRALGDDGLFATGDLGAFDAAGRLLVHGRADNRFISGGENVQPEEIESALAALPGVLRAVVVPVADPEFGQRGVAYVEMADGSAPDAAGLSAALSERLERFKVPSRFHPWPAGEHSLKVSRRGLGGRTEEGA